MLCKLLYVWTILLLSNNYAINGRIYYVDTIHIMNCIFFNSLQTHVAVYVTYNLIYQ